MVRFARDLDKCYELVRGAKFRLVLVNLNIRVLARWLLVSHIDSWLRCQLVNKVA